jgi:hypothetical protein
MKRIQNRNLSPAPTDLCQADVVRELPNLAEAIKLSLEFRTVVDWTEVKRYVAIYKRYSLFARRQEHDLNALALSGAKSGTFQQNAEYVCRLLTIVEKHSKTSARLSAEFRCVIGGQVRRKSKRSDNKQTSG